MAFLSSTSTGFIFAYSVSIFAYAYWLYKSLYQRETASNLKVLDPLVIFLLAGLLYSLGAKYPKEAWFYFSLMEALVLPKIWTASLLSSASRPFRPGKGIVSFIILLFFYNFATQFLSTFDLAGHQGWLLDAWKAGRLPFIVVSVLIITIICESALETRGKNSSLKLVLALAANSYICFLYFLSFLGVSQLRLTFDIMFLVPVVACLVPIVELWLNDPEKSANPQDPVYRESVSTACDGSYRPDQKTGLPLMDEQEKSLRIARTMKDTLVNQQLYLNQNFTATLLAKELRWSEAKVRKSIRELGYRNFNDLVNHYRVIEACRHLEDASKAHIPVSTIAMEAGYKSIPVFHRIFKERKNMTPKEYRDSCLLNCS